MRIEDRIKEMENHLVLSKEGLTDIEKTLESYKKLQSEIEALDHYYGSEQWFSDIEEYESGNVSKNMNAGVLGEDEAYNMFMKNKEIAIEMLEIATKILKNNR